jgi:hypothetical protein
MSDLKPDSCIVGMKVTVSARTLKTRFGGFFHFRLPHRRNGGFIVQ